MSEVVNDVFPKGMKAEVSDDSRNHEFSKGDIVFYLKSIKRSNGDVWHSFIGERGSSQYLVCGEFKIIE